ncbi:MAG: radical SAM family heme chaperone HemW [bacterium]
MNAGLYVHIPFCEIKCGYCDFFVVGHKEPQVQSYLHALKNEIVLQAQDPEIKALRFDTLYFGGGTPSLLSAFDLESLFEAITSLFHFTSNLEVTLETNPGTVDHNKLREYREVGVNRLSLGAQSFQPDELIFLDRTHSAEDIFASFEDARKAHFDNIGLDLIFGLPGQSFEIWRKNVASAVSLAPEHISTYNLTYEPRTPLAQKLRSGKLDACDDDTQKEMFCHAMEFLHEKGYHQYEISNYALDGRQSLHNKKYWNGESYLGLGVSAHSYVNKRRFWNVHSMKKYKTALLDQNNLPVEKEERLTPAQADLERMYLGLRQTKGLDLKQFHTATGSSFLVRHSATLSSLFDDDFKDKELVSGLTSGERNLQSRFLKIEDGFLKLTREGILVSDDIFTLLT